ncbi:TIGR03364 family FAD-dependent oxidoreductase [Nisaea acidiphila]|uniref:TIGR03364 family FAD-dependent oxidoreductase n=1 Tax=Nisaea acidiphila TaxID=1862145 RepID=A0A9J7AN55_9PROT|nr:TIGR03364 family FAD-dependent oxidoreductase [Nisaea acidiphila]UUX48607.1 TIGR03364 family FAD-dependent oxidoreductase [Nisaea acidiphila]
MGHSYDLAIVGGGICGLASALAASKRGKKVVVIDRDAQSNGASVRNFGFVTVTGQKAGETWLRAARSAEIWRDIAPKAGIPVHHEGLLVTAQRPEAVDVLEEFAGTEMGRDCRLLTAAEAAAKAPVLASGNLRAGMWSPHEARVEPRQALPRLAQYLVSEHQVDIRWSTAVVGVEDGRVETTAGRIEAGAVIVCPGPDLSTLFPERLAAYDLRLCKLQMLRLGPQPPEWKLPGAIMSDLSLVRYEGYTGLASSAALRARLDVEQPQWLAHGIHLIVVQGADGSLVVGDSHHYAATPDPFAPAVVEDLILEEAGRVLAIENSKVIERWIGIYPSAADRTAFIDNPSEGVRILVVSSGTGMSTAFALGEETIASLYGAA